MDCLFDKIRQMVLTLRWYKDYFNLKPLPDNIAVNDGYLFEEKNDQYFPIETISQLMKIQDQFDRKKFQISLNDMFFQIYMLAMWIKLN